MTDIKKSMEDAGVKGIDFDTSPSRSYPNETFASQFVGIAQLVEKMRMDLRAYTWFKQAWNIPWIKSWLDRMVW